MIENLFTKELLNFGVTGENISSDFPWYQGVGSQPRGLSLFRVWHKPVALNNDPRSIPDLLLKIGL
ncbi:hypothetical protein FRC0505_02478 [Corynebacterium diphtheriae]|nr:hypothetical protein FRC0024_02413 [Corynebacterium diphtheriae]CAB0867705.1 hypothetical protein FRC0314_02412 [Corynebacterium diphtheriae]CAB1018301.1 hypothetical protein FRC0505_02478 [Corynebacterium diphtheriae]